MKRLLLVVLLLVSGCAAIPTNTQPKPIDPKQTRSNAVNAPEPKQNLAPYEIVRQFIEATSNPDRGYAAAKAYLTPEAEKKWDIKNPVIIETSFSTVPTSQTPQDKAQTVLLQGKYVGRLSTDHSFAPQLGDFTKPIRLEQNSDNQWRIAEPPDGVYMPQNLFNANYRRVPLYFWNPEFTVLVPDPRFVVVAPATEIPLRVTELLVRGPGETVRDSLVTALSPNTDLFKATNEADDGALEVNLTRVGNDLTPEKRKQIVAQVVKSMSGATSSRVRVLVDNVPILPDQRDYRQSDVSETAGESLLASNPQLQGLLVSDGRLRSLQDGNPVKGPAGSGGYSVASAAQSLDGTRLAIVSRESGRQKLRVGELEQDLSEVDLPATSLTRPTWLLSSGPKEPGREVWTVADGTNVVRATRSDNGVWTAKGVNISDIAGLGAISELRLSRDGTRVAMVITGKLYVASVVRNQQDVSLRLARPLQPTALAGTVQSIDWLGQDVLVASSASPTLPVSRVYIDGSRLERYSQSNLTVPVGSVAAGPSRPVQVIDSSGLWTASDISDVWRPSAVRVSAGSQAVYPG